MSSGGMLVVGVCVLIVLYCAVVFLVALFADWAETREVERTAAATFEHAFIPEGQDVLAQEHALLEAVLVSELDQIDAERQRVNRDVAEWVAEA